MLTDEERMSPDIESPLGDLSLPLVEEPRDLSTKRKLKQVPPPLDLSKRNLEPESDYVGISTTSPRSPFSQKNLPLRKRAYSWSFLPECQSGIQLSSISQGVVHVASEIPERNYNNHSTSSLRIPGLPTPYTPHTPHPHSAIPVITTRFNFNEGTDSSVAAREEYHQGPLNLSTTSVGALPSSLLSPAPSHPSTSSLNSSREELENENMISDYNTPEFSVHYSNHLHIGNTSHRNINSVKQENFDIHPPMSVSPNMNASHFPSSVWCIFLSGVQIHFVLSEGRQITGATLSEDLAQLEITSQNKYAPHGAQLIKILHEEMPLSVSQHSCHLYFKPVGVQQEGIIAVIPRDHPFFVLRKGWCSMIPEKTCEIYNFQCQHLHEGDICLLSSSETSHTPPVSVITPDLTDAMKRFDFTDDPVEQSGASISMYHGPPSATFAPSTQRSIFLSPPTSPSKKCIARGTGMGISSNTEGSVSLRSRRPMNGFMLFAKYHRLRLIQQHPGKDNRAISVLLGGLWKGLPEHERERYNAEARVQAEERKKVDPDCWKRKRSHSTS